MNSFKKTKESYHFAKLALFNIRLLNKFQQATDDDPMKKAIVNEAKASGMTEVPSLLNQGTFLQFSYMCLVWLWETAKVEGIEDKVIGNFEKISKEYNIAFPDSSQIKGERKIENWKEVIGLLRNALGHGRVEVSDSSLTFSDQNKHSKPLEVAPADLTLKWEQLAVISETVIHSLTPILWPELANK